MLDTASPSITADALTVFNHAKEMRRPLIGKWMANYSVVHNKTWSRHRKAGHPKTEIPEIYPILASIVAWETDQSPHYAIAPSIPPFSPVAPYYADLAADLEWVLNTNWEALDYSSEASQILWDGELYGIGYGKTFWDGAQDNGLGNVMMRRVDPFCMYLDPDAKSWKDCNFVVETKTCSISDVKRRFPKANTENLNFRMDTSEAPTQISGTARRNTRPNLARLPTPTASGPGTNTTSMGAPSGNAQQIMDGTVTLLEIWYRTTEKATIAPADTSDPTPKTPNRSKTMDQWHCLIFSGDQILLHKTAVDLLGSNVHPYARYVPLEEGELYGYSLVEQLAPMQISVNRMFASIEHNAWLAGNPILVKKNGERNDISNRPGERIEVNDPNQDVRWLAPPPISREHLEVINKLIEEMERISGMSAIVRGSSPQGRPSEGVVNTIQDSAFVRIRMRLRNYERFLRETGLLQAALITEFYDESRVMSRIGDDGQAESIRLSAQHFLTPGKDGQEPLKFNLRVRAGASDAIGREARMAMYERFFAIGAIDGEALLKLAQVPGWHEITQRVQEQQAAAGTQGMPPTQRAAARR
jgi:hypothetical protein